MLLKVEDLSVHFSLPRTKLWEKPQFFHAVRNVSFEIAAKTSFGLVGESGSGKTTTGMAAIRLIPPTSGRVLFEGEDLCRLSASEMRRRRRDIQLIFQDPYSSLNPRMRVGDIVREPMDLLDVGAAGQRRKRTQELFEKVGLRPDQMALFPHQFSGGQRQRISIARALSTHPKLLVCDEPVSALDVAIQAQILNLLADLKDDLGLSYLFISHDLGVVRYICDEVAVIYSGEIIEHAPSEVLFHNPQHAYTKTLLSAAPSLRKRKSQRLSRGTGCDDGVKNRAADPVTH